MSITSQVWLSEDSKWWLNFIIHLSPQVQYFLHIKTISLNFKTVFSEL